MVSFGAMAGQAMANTPAPPDWAQCVAAAKCAFAEAVNLWVENSRVDAKPGANTGTVRGVVAFLWPGALFAERLFYDDLMVQTMEEAIPGLGPYATAIAYPLWTAWSRWASRFQIEIPGVPMDFLCWPGAMTADHPLAQYPKLKVRPGEPIPELGYGNWQVGLGRSDAESDLAANALVDAIVPRLRQLVQQHQQSQGGSGATGGGAPGPGRSLAVRLIANTWRSGRLAKSVPTKVGLARAATSRMLTAMPTAGAGSAPAASPDAAITDLASWVHSRFHAWKRTASLTRLRCRGYTSGFAPPYVPVAAVTSGLIWSAAGCSAIDADPFPFR